MAKAEIDSGIASRTYHWNLSNFSCISSEALVRRGKPVVEIERRGVRLKFFAQRPINLSGSSWQVFSDHEMGMKASPYYLRTAVMRRWTVEAGGMEGRSGAAHGVSVRTLYRVNQIRRLDRQVALAEVVGQQELAWSSGGRSEAVEAVWVALQRLVQQIHELALALA